MAYEHRNRRGDIYLLQIATTRKGNPRYYFGRKLTGQPVDDIPSGYEVLESPERGQVYLRSQRRTCIVASERETVMEGMRRLSNVDYFIVDAEEDSLIMYLPTRSGHEVNELVCLLAGADALQVRRFRETRDQLVRESEYQKMLRFQ